ncbi:MAG: hypothetical protein DHS20C07_14710 [Methyloligella sp.]|nr:MAG: hypothetical protein DHS20C07_14710 [Methyloligella sp.]
MSEPDEFYAGSYGGNNDKIDDSTRLECKICWHIYDPKEGDDYWQIPAGTPFAKLPDHWTCPNCDGKREEFMVVKD